MEMLPYNALHPIVFTFCACGVLNLDGHTVALLTAAAAFIRAHLISYFPSHLSFHPSPHLHFNPFLWTRSLDFCLSLAIHLDYHLTALCNRTLPFSAGQSLFDQLNYLVQINPTPRLHSQEEHPT